MLSENNLSSEFNLNVSFLHSFQISQEEFDRQFDAKNIEDSCGNYG
jgi:hypothetical protein